jgi:hypothetical protein
MKSAAQTSATDEGTKNAGLVFVPCSTTLSSPTADPGAMPPIDRPTSLQQGAAKREKTRHKHNAEM